MKDFQHKVAVVTGAASGIGRAIAGRCTQEGMKVVLADIEALALQSAADALRQTGADVLAVRTDVSKASDMERLAQQTLDTYGGVHLLFNNAGVAAGGTIWESTLADWEWVMGVNLWGVIHGLRIFVPIMLAQETECYIVNTASVAGLVDYFPNASYHVTKHAVVALTEQLHHSLADQSELVKTSVLCPSWVKTQILESGRNRPEHLQNPASNTPAAERSEEAPDPTVHEMEESLDAGMPPKQVADIVFAAIQAEIFYIFTDPEFAPFIQERCDQITSALNPSPITEVDSIGSHVQDKRTPP